MSNKSSSPRTTIHRGRLLTAAKSPGPQEERLLSGAVAWRLCRERLGRVALSQQTLLEWVNKVRERQSQKPLPDPLANLSTALPELEISDRADQESELGEYGICCRRILRLSEDSDCRIPNGQELAFGDLYQVITFEPTDRGMRVVGFGVPVEGYLSREDHLVISPGEFRILAMDRREVRLTFLVKLLNEKNKKS